MRRMILLLALFAACALPAGAATKMRFWNLTAEEITELYLAAAGTEQFGPNQCLNDDDKSVEADERLNLKDVTPGRYDVKFVDVKGRQCVVKNIEVKAGGPYAFSITEKEVKDPAMTSCTK
jgi:hypothetical protein